MRGGRKRRDGMEKHYLGHLPKNDPLYGYLRNDIQPLLAGGTEDIDYRVYMMPGSNDVYVYEDASSGRRVVGKFFLSPRQPDYERAARRLGREFRNLALMREHGFDHSPHYIARPLGANYLLNCLLVVEFCYGEQLSAVILRAMEQNDEQLLYDKLGALAFFLAEFHNRTVSDGTVDFAVTCAYMDRLTARLREINAINADELTELNWLRDRWRDQPRMWADRQVYVHGDATPGNFLFGDGLNVISFDLERLHYADRIFDTGRIAGELSYFYMRHRGNKTAAERFIGHFLWEYACHFPDRERAFATMNARVPFYMGITFLRIARNEWIAPDFKAWLIAEAKQCLRSF